MSHLALQAAKIVGAFLVVHHFLPKGYPYGGKEDWEKAYYEKHGRLSLRRRSSPDKGSKRRSRSEGPSRTNSTRSTKSVHFYHDDRQHDRRSQDLYRDARPHGRRSQDWYRNERPCEEYVERRYLEYDDERISRSRHTRRASPR